MFAIKKCIPHLVLIFFITIQLHPAYAYDGLEPSGIARLSVTNGAISLLPAGEKSWVKATINRPMVTGDRVWSASKSFLELQLDTATIRLGNETSVKILNLNQKITQLQLSSGTLIIKVWHLKPKQIVEISTPNLAFLITKPGYYRLFVNNKAKITVISVMQGIGKIYGAKAAYQISQGKSCPFGDNLKIYRCTSIPAADSLE